jgi:hypothetical protein
MDPGSWILDPGCWILGLGSWILLWSLPYNVWALKNCVHFQIVRYDSELTRDLQTAWQDKAVDSFPVFRKLGKSSGFFWPEEMPE